MEPIPPPPAAPAGTPQPPSPPPPAWPRWTYRVVSVEVSERWFPRRQAEEFARFEASLNAMGNEGWELIAFESIPLTGAFTGSVKGYAYLALLKRPI